MGSGSVNSAIVWSLIFVVVALFAYYVTCMARRDREPEGLNDFGLAIVEFGRAFPNEAIRDLHATADAHAVFVRLHDGKAGILQSHMRHYVCHLIKPGRVRVHGMEDPRGFSAEFLDAPRNNGNFIFKNEAEAAEVSLWLLGNYVSSDDRAIADEPA